MLLLGRSITGDRGVRLVANVQFVGSGVDGQTAGVPPDCDGGEDAVAGPIDHRHIVTVQIGHIDTAGDGVNRKAGGGLAHRHRGEQRVACRIQHRHAVAARVAYIQAVATAVHVHVCGCLAHSNGSFQVAGCIINYKYIVSICGQEEAIGCRVYPKTLQGVRKIHSGFYQIGSAVDDGKGIGCLVGYIIWFVTGSTAIPRGSSSTRIVATIWFVSPSITVTLPLPPFEM